MLDGRLALLKAGRNQVSLRSESKSMADRSSAPAKGDTVTGSPVLKRSFSGFAQDGVSSQPASQSQMSSLQ